MRSTSRAPKRARQPAATVIGEQHEPPSGEAATKLDAPLDAASPRIQVRFVLADLGARQVALCGEFNGWCAENNPMTRNSSGTWETTLELPPGRYQYKFFVDGEWIPDPLSTETLTNPYGSINSVIDISPEPLMTCNCRSYLKPERP